MNGQMDERVSGWMGGWMDGWMAVGRRANISEPTCKTIRFLKKLREYRPVPMHCIFYFQTSDSKGTGPAFPQLPALPSRFRTLFIEVLGSIHNRVCEVKTLPVHKYKWERHHGANTSSRETSRQIITSLPTALESGGSSRPLPEGGSSLYSFS